MWRLLRISGNGIFQVMIGTASWVGVVRLLSGFGSAVVAGYTIGIRIIVFAILPSWGLSNAAATLVGQNLGAGKPDRAERSVWIAALYNMIFLGSVGLLFVFFARPLIGLFTKDPAITPFGVDCLRIISYGFPLLRLRHGDDAGLQRRRRHVDADTDQSLHLLALGDPARVCALAAVPLGPARRLRGDRDCLSTLAVVSTTIFRRGKWKLKKI